MNFRKAKNWFIWTLLCAGFFGIVGGFMVQSNAPNKDMTDAFLVGAYVGVVYGGLLPFCVFVWFLFLHMIGQTSDAIKGKKEVLTIDLLPRANQRKKRARNK